MNTMCMHEHVVTCQREYVNVSIVLHSHARTHTHTHLQYPNIRATDTQTHTYTHTHTHNSQTSAGTPPYLREPQALARHAYAKSANT